MADNAEAWAFPADALGVRAELGMALRFYRRGLAHGLLSGCALVSDRDQALAALDAFWLRVESRARAAGQFGDKLTLAAFSEAVMAAPAIIHQGGAVRDGSDLGSNYFTEGEAALLVPKSAQSSVTPRNSVNTAR